MDTSNSALLVNSLRSLWPNELKRFSDNELVDAYKEFKSAEPCDDNQFLMWIFMTDG